MSAVVLLSGGLDSCVLAAWLKSRGDDLRAIAFDYGQRHVVELGAARLIARDLGISLTVVEMRSLAAVLGGSSQTDPSVPVPHGHYAAASMRATVVPNRNMIMLAVAAGHAITVGADEVCYAAHAGDHPVYADCRPEFVSAMSVPLGLCHDAPGVRLRAPFVEIGKHRIVEIGASVGAPMHLTWSCYQGGAVHCGQCGTCVERREAFLLAGVTDPTEYM